MHSTPDLASAAVVIAIDPNKAPWTAVAVDTRLQPVASIRVPVNRDGYRQLRRFARRWPNASWAIEGAAWPWRPADHPPGRRRHPGG